MVVGVLSAEELLALEVADLREKSYPIGGVIASPLASRGLRSTGDPHRVAGNNASRAICLREKNMSLASKK
jgi:hypothetical protein